MLEAEAAAAVAEEEASLRTGVRLDEHYDRGQLQRQWSTLLLLGPAVDAPAPPALPVPHIFENNILAPTVVKRTAPLLELEVKLRALEHRDRHDASSAPFRLRLLQRREATAREALEAEAAHVHGLLATARERGMRELVHAIAALPAEVRGLAMLRMRAEERLVFALRPAVVEENRRRSIVACAEHEARRRMALLAAEAVGYHRLLERFRTVGESIRAFLVAQWLLHNAMTATQTTGRRYLGLWRGFAASACRRRRVVGGLSRIRRASQWALLARYCGRWSGPIQQRRWAGEAAALIADEASERDGAVLAEAEGRGRACTAEVERLSYQCIVDAHFSQLEPLIARRKAAAAEELEMLNAARLALGRLQTMYLFAVRRKGAARCAFIAAGVVEAHRRGRMATWAAWAARRAFQRVVLRIRTAATCEAFEAGGRLVMAEGAQRALTRAGVRCQGIARRGGPSAHRCRLEELAETLASRTTARLLGARQGTWLRFTGARCPNAAAVVLALRTARRVLGRYMAAWARLHASRRALAVAADVPEAAGRAVLAAAEDEAFRRILLEERAFRWARCIGAVARRRGQLADRRQAVAMRPAPLWAPHLMRQRFVDWIRLVRRLRRHRTASAAVSTQAAKTLRWGRFWDWALRAVLRRAAAERADLVAAEHVCASELLDAAVEGRRAVVRAELLRRSDALMRRNDILRGKAAFRRLGLLVERRRRARAKLPPCLDLRDRLALALMERYVQYWRKVVSRARVLHAAEAMAARLHAIILSRYFQCLAPHRVRAAKIARAVRGLAVAEEAATALDRRVLALPDLPADALSLHRNLHHISTGGPSLALPFTKANALASS